MAEPLDLDVLQRRIDVLDNVGVSAGEQQQMLTELREARVRIAAALVICDDYDHNYCALHVRRALTGETS
jgi:hypothetical protein